jgi:FecR protein
MRKASYHTTLWLLPIALLLSAVVTGKGQNKGQNREKFVISAKAGGINAITGQASVHGKGESEWQQLMVTDDLNAGDIVRTASDGRVEILLNPGSYLRVGGNSEVELANNSLDSLELRLLRGAAIVEATGADGLELNIGVTTPHAKIAIVRQGLYRLNVIPGDATVLIVRKGRVILTDSHTKVKGGNKVVFSATNVMVAKLTDDEKKNQEDIEAWSKSRAKDLAQANRRISDRMLNSAFASYRDPFSLFGPRNTGLWFFNARAGCYTFLPFYNGWGSPYGSSYSIAIYNPVVTYNGGSANPSTTWLPGHTGNQTGVQTGGMPSGSPSGGVTRPPMSAAPRDPDSGRIMRKVDVTPEPGRPIQP